MPLKTRIQDVLDNEKLKVTGKLADIQELLDGEEDDDDELDDEELVESDDDDEDDDD